MADETNKPVRRRLRTAPVETIRERNLRLSNKQDAETKKQSEKTGTSPLSVFWSGFTWPLRKLGRLLARIGRFLGKYRVFRFIGRIFWPRWLRNNWRELRQVTWPGRRKSWQLTYAVIIFSVIFGIIVAAVDYVLDKIFKELIIN